MKFFCRFFITTFTLSLLIIEPSANAATINAISSKKGMVSLKTSADETFKAKDKVCIFAKNQEKLACGGVLKVKDESKLIMRVADPQELAKLKKGSSVTLKADSSTEGDDSPSDSSAKMTNTKSKRSPFRLAIGWDSSLLPFSYNQISYLPPETTPPTTLWQSTKAVSAGLIPPPYLGITADIGIPIGARGVSLGLRYQVFQPSLVSSNYDPTTFEPYVSTEVKAKAIGFWADFLAIRKQLSQRFALNILSGLDFDSVAVSVAATKLTDGPPATSAPLVTAEGKLSIISLRAGARADIKLFSVVGVSLGATALIPLVAQNTLTANFADGEGRDLEDPIIDLKTSLGLKKESFGIEALITTYINF